MSGIIGGAGSKSGVIGTTELDYEEGTWTPALKVNTPNPISAVTDPRYVKIGSQVTLYISTFDTPASSSGSNQGITGFPFTIGDGYSTGTSVCSSANAAVHLGVQDSTECLFYAHGSVGTSNATGLANKSWYGWKLTYHTIS